MSPVLDRPRRSSQKRGGGGKERRWEGPFHEGERRRGDGMSPSPPSSTGERRAGPGEGGRKKNRLLLLSKGEGKPVLAFFSLSCPLPTEGGKEKKGVPFHFLRPRGKKKKSLASKGGPKLSTRPLGVWGKKGEKEALLPILCLREKKEKKRRKKEPVSASTLHYRRFRRGKSEKGRKKGKPFPLLGEWRRKGGKEDPITPTSSSSHAG